jgi:cell division septum initiation protein DivIVA
VYNIHKKEVKELQEKIERLEAELKEYQEIEVKPERKSSVGEEPF